MALTRDQVYLIIPALTDGIYWAFAMGEIIIKSALEKFGIGCLLENATDSSYFVMLKKHVGALCCRCGSGSHLWKDCNFSRRVQCSHCGSDKHNTSVCAYKFLPMYSLWSGRALRWQTFRVPTAASSSICAFIKWRHGNDTIVEIFQLSAVRWTLRPAIALRPGQEPCPSRYRWQTIQPNGSAEYALPSSEVCTGFALILPKVKLSLRWSSACHEWSTTSMMYSDCSNPLLLSACSRQSHQHHS